MKKLLIPLIIFLTFTGTAYAAQSVFTSPQVGSTPTNGYVLQTNGSNSTWVATSTLGITGGGGGTSNWATSSQSYWQSLFGQFIVQGSPQYLTPTTTIPVLLNSSTTLQNFTALNSTSTNATTTNFFSTNASSTNSYFTTGNGGSLNLSGVLQLTPLATPAGTFLAADRNGNVIATSAPSGGGSGTVTSVALTADPSLTITGSPITTSGTLNIAVSSGYQIPTNSQLPFTRIGNTVEYTNQSFITSLGTTTQGLADLYVWGNQNLPTLDIFDVGTSSNPLFNVTAGGNVGVGTSSPPEKLTVAGSGGTRILIDDNTSYAAIAINSANNTAAFDFRHANLSKWGTGLNGASNNYVIWDASQSNLPIVTILNGQPFDNFGIGSSSPSTALVVSGTTTALAFTATSTTIASTLPLASTTALTVSGTNGLTISALGQGWLGTAGGSSPVTSSTSPTVNYITATSTTGTSTFSGGVRFPNVLTLSATAAYFSPVLDSSGNLYLQPNVSSISDVLDNTLSTPPGAPNNGDAYLVASSPTGAWSGQTNNIATWNGASWTFYVPVAGNQTTVTTGVNAGSVYNFNGSAWVIVGSTSGTYWSIGGNILTPGLTEKFGTLTNDAISIVASTTNVATFSTSTNVGIGSTTPFYKLSVSGVVGAQNFISTSSLEANASVFPRFTATYSTTTNATTTTNDTTQELINNYQATGSTVPLFTVASSTGKAATSTLFIVAANGNTGLGGTTTPWATLGVQATSTQWSVAVSSTTASNGKVANLEFGINGQGDAIFGNSTTSPDAQFTITEPANTNCSGTAGNPISICNLFAVDGGANGNGGTGEGGFMNFENANPPGNFTITMGSYIGGSSAAGGNFLIQGASNDSTSPTNSANITLALGTGWAAGSTNGNIILGTTSPDFSLAGTGVIYSIPIKESTTTSNTVDGQTIHTNNPVYGIGSANETFTLQNFNLGEVITIQINNPLGTAGTITWNGVQWDNDIQPTQNTTANKIQLWNFRGIMGTSTGSVIIEGLSPTQGL